MRAIFWDFGNVLVFFDHMRGCQALATYTNKSAQDIYDLVFGSLLEEKEYNCGVYSDQEWYQLCVERLQLRNCSYEAFATKWGDIFTANPLIDDVLCALKPDVQKFVLSNTNGLHWSWAQQNLAVLHKHFPNSRQAIISSEEKCRKPDTRIYDLALERAGVSAKQAVFIDDKVENIEAFEAIGGHGIVYNAHWGSTANLTWALKEYKCI